ncbi:hypothetical protein NFI96_003229 [Prochilodus magdalenae]|nr:hypothetical protein NFI96_003229 [Prochilodus magdalenae]
MLNDMSVIINKPENKTTLIDEEDNMGEEDMGGTTSSGTMASTSTQIASPPHLSTGDTSTAQDAAKSSVLSTSFFGVLQRLYNLFSSSVQRWAVLRKHVKQLTLKPLSATRWEARIDSVKVVRYQLPEILEALSALQTFGMEKGDSETMSSAKSLHDELKTWSFLLCTIIWYNVLYQVNHVSKLLQSPNVSMGTLRAETEGVREYLEDFRENGLASCQTDAKDIAENLDMEMNLPEKRQRKKKRQFQYEGTEETQSTPDETFRRDFFLPLVDTALRSLGDRFSRLKGVYDLYDFLFSKDNMKQTIKNGKLHERCKKLEQTLHDIDADDLALEINSSLHTFPDHVATCPFDMLNYIYSEKLLDLYSNLSIALRLLLTLPVSVASGERSFSALKLIKTYMRSTMGQERLTGLALMSIEREVCRSLDMEDIVVAFAEAKEQPPLKKTALEDLLGDCFTEPPTAQTNSGVEAEILIL